MSNQLKFFLILTLVVSGAAVETQADLVTPTSATASSSFAIPPSALIDGSGLDGMGQVTDQLHDTNENFMWISGNGASPPDQELEFTLDRNYNLSAAYVWNYNGVDGFGTDNSPRGVDAFEILVSPDLVSEYVSVGMFNLAQADPLFTMGEPSQTRPLTSIDADNVRRVKFNIDSTHGANDFVGLSEVRFEGTALALGPDRTWVADSFGNWLDDANWDPAAAPNGNDQTATFGGGITAPRTVVADQTVTVNAITFDNMNSYVIAGAGSVTLEADSGDASATVSAGSHQFQAVVNIASNASVDVETGAELIFNNALNLNGNTVSKTGGGTLTINNQLNTGGGSINGAAGIIGGHGTVGGDLNNMSATVAPGSSVGTLSVENNYTQAASGTLAIEISGLLAGTEYDVLDVGGMADLAGSLDIDLVDFTPAAGDFFDVVTATDLSAIGLTLSGESDGFSFSVLGGNTLRLMFGDGGVTGDFNGDGAWDCLDIDALVGEIAAMGADLSFDMNGDGVITATDITDPGTGWLSVGGANNPDQTGGNPFLAGDATLDGIVDGLDFIEWNNNKFTAIPEWCSGDFTADGIVDGLDFIEWNNNKFMSSDHISAVPEPSSSLTLVLICLFGFAQKRRR